MRAYLLVLALFVLACVPTSAGSGVVTSEKEDVTSERRMATRCVKTSSCACRRSDGVIDLLPLAGNTTARYIDVPDTQGAAMYSWNPCLSFSETANCVGVAACQRSIGVNETSQNIGIQDSAEFITLATGELTLQYTFADPSGVNRTTIVTLQCDPDAENTIEVFGEMVPFHYSITLKSPFACVREG